MTVANVQHFRHIGQHWFIISILHLFYRWNYSSILHSACLPLYWYIRWSTSTRAAGRTFLACCHRSRDMRTADQRIYRTGPYSFWRTTSPSLHDHELSVGDPWGRNLYNILRIHSLRENGRGTFSQKLAAHFKITTDTGRIQNLTFTFTRYTLGRAV